MFRMYRRWGAAPRMELDPSFRIRSHGRWVGDFINLDHEERRCVATLDLASATGLLVGDGLMAIGAKGASIQCSIEGEEVASGLSMLIWLQSPFWRAPLEAHGAFDATRTVLNGEWAHSDGLEGDFVLRKV